MNISPEEKLEYIAHAENNLDATTKKAFDAIRKEGFDPYLIKGHSVSALMASRQTIGMEPNSTIQVESPKIDYTAVLFAAKPELTFENLRFTSRCKEVADLVPEQNGNLRIGYTNVIDFDGNSIHGQGKL
ncbi:MAG: hypothetical protein V1725_03220 [archaeon]